MTPQQIAHAHDLILDAEVVERRRLLWTERYDVLAGQTDWSDEEIFEAIAAVRQAERTR